MTGAMLTDLLKSLGLLGAFLLIGVLLRAKVKVFQKTFMPASVIGGFLLLILGPQVLNAFSLVGIPDSWFTVYGLLPGIFIVPVVASVPLGLRLGGGKSGGSVGKMLKSVLPLIGIGLAVAMMQFALGFGTHLLFKGSFDFYDVFGIELAIGYVGGHGTAGTLGNMLGELNLPYALTAQGVATTTATFGLVGGIIIGIIAINWAARNGQTALLKKPADIPEPIRVGFEKDVAKQSSVGRETTSSSSIDTMAFHGALIFLACLLAYTIIAVSKSLKIPVLQDISVWAYGMIVMFGIWGIMNKLKVDHLVDAKVKSKISGSLTEFAIIAAIATVPIKAVAAYLVPILFMCAIGWVLTFFMLFFFSKLFLKGAWFEMMIATFGMSTGVFLTGILLLRICDPDFETEALPNYSLSYTVTSIIYFALLSMFISLLVVPGGVINALWVSLAIMVGSLIVGVASALVLNKKPA